MKRRAAARRFSLKPIRNVERLSPAKSVPARKQKSRSPATPANRSTTNAWLALLPSAIVVNERPWEQNGTHAASWSKVRVNLAGMQAGSVVFHAAVTDAAGTIVRQVSEDPATYWVSLLFSFRGVDEVGSARESDRRQNER